jgi:LPS sulfotransferase NodH
MLSGIDTGYEGKFDFPPRPGRPATPWLLATVPRTGSTWLSHLLWRTGCLGAPLEYLNFDAAGPYGFAAASPDLQRDLWRSVLSRRTAPNGVFGLKCFPMQLEALVAGNPPLLAEVMALLLPRGGGARRVVHLVRRDRAAHAASYARATLSGVWRKDQPGGEAADPAYSPAAMATAERWLDTQAAAWEAMFAALGIAPLRLVYEEALAAPEETAARVADFLGVTLDPAAAVAVPAIEKQGGGEDWAARYAADRGAPAGAA